LFFIVQRVILNFSDDIIPQPNNGIHSDPQKPAAFSGR